MSRRIAATVLVAAFILLLSPVLAQIPANGAVGFVSSDKTFAFALNIPKDENDTLHFTLQGTDSSWIAVGMGSEKMKDSLIFMAYAASNGKDVTLSPRLGFGNTEPAYTSKVTVEVLPGSGVVNGTIKVNAKCNNCRSWGSGGEETNFVDPNSKAGKFIFASGPGGNIKSNSPRADVKYHTSHGSFVMDLTQAVGEPLVPDAIEINTPGSIELTNKADGKDWTGAVHACLMILTFVGLLPLGIMILRILKSPKWHGIAQGISMVVALIGMSLGAWMGTKYNRTKGFNTPHQIIGVIVIISMVGQFVLGFLHHRIYKSTEGPTKLAPIHIWLGRFVIVLGIVNGFIGFPLALNPKYDLALLSCILFVAIVFGPFAFWRYRRNIQKEKHGDQLNSGGGYQSQPWATQGQSRSDISMGPLNHGPTPYQGHPATQGRQFV